MQTVGGGYQTLFDASSLIQPTQPFSSSFTREPFHEDRRSSVLQQRRVPREDLPPRLLARRARSERRVKRRAIWGVWDFHCHQRYVGSRYGRGETRVRRMGHEEHIGGKVEAAPP